MPETTLYLRDLTAEADAFGVGTVEQSASMAATVSTTRPPRDLITETPEIQTGGQTNAAVADSVSAQQRLFLGKFVTPELAVSTLEAGTWEAGIAAAVGSDIEASLCVVAYVEQADHTIRGYVYDEDADQSSEVGTAKRGRVFTFTGAEVAGVASDDRLVLEVWLRCYPPTAGLVVNTRIIYDGAIEPVEAVATDAVYGAASYLRVPQASLFGSTETDAIASSTSPESEISAATGVVDVAELASDTTPTSAITGASEAEPFASAIVSLNHSVRPNSTITARVTGSGNPDEIGSRCWGGAQPWLRYDGVEIANLGRLRNYAIQLAPGLVQWGCAPNDIVFRASGLPDTFTHPSVDPAPWWDVNYPESGEFFGICLEPLIDIPWSRSETELLEDGAALGPLRLKAKTLRATGFITATTHRGAEYGRRWLASKTKGCAACQAGADLEVYLAAPPQDWSDDDVGRYTLRNVGVRSLTFGNGPPELVECEVVFTCGDPRLYKTPNVIVPFQTLPVTNQDGECVPFVEWYCGAPDPSIVAAVVPPPFGDLATIITIDASDEGIGGVTVEVWEDCTDEGSVLGAATIGRLESGSVFVMDSSQRTATYYAPDGSIQDGTLLLDIPDDVGLPWLVIDSCQSARCLAVRRARYCSGGEATRVQVQTVHRSA